MYGVMCQLCHKYRLVMVLSGDPCVEDVSFVINIGW